MLFALHGTLNYSIPIINSFLKAEGCDFIILSILSYILYSVNVFLLNIGFQRELQVLIISSCNFQLS